MLQWCRRQASRIGATAVCAMVVVGGSAVVPHDDDCHEGVCLAVAADAAALRVSPVASDDDSHALHCLVCHWVRAFRPRAEARVASIPQPDPGAGVHSEPVVASAGTRLARPPLRSPPSPSPA